MTNKYLDYAKAFTADGKVFVWITVNLNNYLKDNNENQDEIEHIIDYLVSDKCPERISKMAYNEAKSNTEKWNNTLIKKVLGWEPSIPLRTGMQKTYDWIHQQMAAGPANAT